MKIFNKEEGSITLEAALIMPFFMLFIIFLATLIRIGIADMALYKSVSETNQIVASYAYPVDLAKSGIEAQAKTKLSNIMPGDMSVEEVATWTQEGMKFFLDIDIGANIENMFEHFSKKALEPIIQEKFVAATGGNDAFNPNNLRVTNVNLPYGSGGDYFEIDVEYELDINFPFINKKIILQKKSYERLWKGS